MEIESFYQCVCTCGKVTETRSLTFRCSQCNALSMIEWDALQPVKTSTLEWTSEKCANATANMQSRRNNVSRKMAIAWSRQEDVDKKNRVEYLRRPHRTEA